MKTAYNKETTVHPDAISCSLWVNHHTIYDTKTKTAI